MVERLAPESPPAPVVAAAEPPAPPVVVATRPVRQGIIVRTADWKTRVEIIGDDELVEAVPGLALARVGLSEGQQRIIVDAPGLGRVERVY
jgi:hypothetical protein